MNPLNDDKAKKFVAQAMFRSARIEVLTTLIEYNRISMEVFNERAKDFLPRTYRDTLDMMVDHDLITARVSPKRNQTFVYLTSAGTSEAERLVQSMETSKVVVSEIRPRGRSLRSLVQVYINSTKGKYYPGYWFTKRGEEGKKVMITRLVPEPAKARRFINDDASIVMFRFEDDDQEYPLSLGAFMYWYEYDENQNANPEIDEKETSET